MSIEIVSDPRWEASVTYKTDKGHFEWVYDLSELSELAVLVERGPAWWTIVDIKINFAGYVDPRVSSGTVEEADRF